jgi:hypothetical protein
LQPQLNLEAQQRMQALTFHPITPPASSDTPGQKLRTLPVINFQSFNEAFRNRTAAVKKKLS